MSLSLLVGTTVNPDISCFKNSVDSHQLASMKPVDHDPHCFPFCYCSRPMLTTVCFVALHPKSTAMVIGGGGGGGESAFPGQG